MKIMNVLFVVLFIGTLQNVGCRARDVIVESTYSFIKPDYDLERMKVTSDTLNITLDDSTFNSIRSINCFSEGGISYLAIHDKQLETINIYNFETRKITKRIKLKQILKDPLYKTTSYTVNFDSIFVANYASLTLLDSSGRIKKRADFLTEPPLAWSIIQNDNPIVIRGNKIYTAVRNNVKETSIAALKKWKVLYEYDISKRVTHLYYNLPERFRDSIYGYRALDVSYCCNNKGNFVFSFAGDSLIYETNLKGLHTSYLGRSKYQTSLPSSVEKSEFSRKEGYENYLLNDSYGSVFFDSFRRRYLRIVRQKIGKQDYLANQINIRQSIIILNEDFKIIGESLIDNKVWLETIFFTPEGEIYARFNGEDEYAIHLVRLAYVEAKN